MKNVLILLVILGFVAACSSKSDGNGSAMAEMPASEKSLSMASAPARMAMPEQGLNEQRARNSFLAYEHSLELSVPDKELQSRYDALTKRCLEDKAFSCILLNSNIRGGDHASANLSLRIKPQGVDAFIELASENAEIKGQSTRADDLTERVMDVEKRLEQLQSYRDKLIALEEKSADDVDALIKVSTELSRTQTQLEYAQGEKASLYKRIQSDILNIHLYSDKKESAFYSLGEALGDFGEDLADGLANFITAFAYLLPWLFFVLLVFYVFRYLWKRRNRSRQE